MTPQSFAYLTRVLMDIADACCQGRLVITLEGGYHVQGQTEGVKRVLQEMRDDTHAETSASSAAGGEEGHEHPIIQQVIEKIRPYWPVF